MKKGLITMFLFFTSYILLGGGQCKCWEYGTSTAVTYAWNVGEGEGCCTGTAAGLGFHDNYVWESGGWEWVSEGSGSIQDGSEYQNRCCPPT